jgi:Zn finger protein HypA/HybF involved in hydrogenase expression
MPNVSCDWLSCPHRGNEMICLNKGSPDNLIFCPKNIWEKEIERKHRILIERMGRRMKKRLEEFQEKNPCPKCGSHNVDIDWGCPIHCYGCGYEWSGAND